MRTSARRRAIAATRPLASRQRIPAFDGIQNAVEAFCAKYDVYVRWTQQVGSTNYRLLEVCHYGERWIDYRPAPGEDMHVVMEAIMRDPNRFAMPIGCGSLWHYESHSIHSVCPSCGGTAMRRREPFRPVY